MSNVYDGRKKPRKLKIPFHLENKIIKNTRNCFRVKKENVAIKDRLIKDIKTLFEFLNSKKNIITNQ